MFSPSFLTNCTFKTKWILSIEHVKIGEETIPRVSLKSYFQNSRVLYEVQRDNMIRI